MSAEHITDIIPGDLTRRSLLAAAPPLLLATGCGTPSTGTAETTSDAASSSSGSDTSSGTGAASDSSSPSATAVDPLAGWSIEDKAGQLVMVGSDASASSPDEATYDALNHHHIGNIFLAGRSEDGSSHIRSLVDDLTSSSTAPEGVTILVATDQEGGEVQVLKGDGLSDIPAALDQADSAPEDLKAQAATWGKELADAGVNLNLAPVMDVIPDADHRKQNKPIGYYRRNYGYGSHDVFEHALAFGEGMGSAGVAPVYKHFPGLGLVTANTDTDSGVTDDQTTESSDPIKPFGAVIDHHAGFIMVSSAIYEHIDSEQEACFSTTVINQFLRTQLGFDGVVITDDLSGAKQVEHVETGDRAVRAIEAGCDIVLASVDASVAIDMVEAIVDRANSDSDFASRVDTAVKRVLAAKGN